MKAILMDDPQYLRKSAGNSAGPITFFGAISVQTIAVGFRYFRIIMIITA
ncbi:MAG: hypothetical protein ABIN18_24265 [Pseudomonadota bacterium]